MYMYVDVDADMFDMCVVCVCVCVWGVVLGRSTKVAAAVVTLNPKP